MKNKYYKFYVLAILLLVTLFPFQDIMAQCAMCRATVENNVSEGITGLATGLNLGIVYLFVTPYLVVIVIGFLWYKKSKANAKRIRLTRHYRG